MRAGGSMRSIASSLIAVALALAALSVGPPKTT